MNKEKIKTLPNKVESIQHLTPKVKQLNLNVNLQLCYGGRIYEL